MKKYLRYKVSKLGEYCNINPYDMIAYSFYLMFVDLLY